MYFFHSMRSFIHYSQCMMIAHLRDKDTNKIISLRKYKSMSVVSLTSKGLIELLMHGHHASLYLHKNELYTNTTNVQCTHCTSKMLIEDEKKILNEIKIKKMFDLCACERHTMRGADMRWRC